MMIPPDVDARVTELLAGASTGDKLVNTVHQIMVLFREHGLVTSMRLVPAAVGVHPKNRDGTGLNSADVHTLLSNLLEVGFVAERTHCVAIEPANEQELDWNNQLVGSCQGLLGTMKPQTLKALSLCGSHTNFALRIVADGAPHEGPESHRVTVGGHLDVALVAKVDAALAEHVQKGLNWEVLSSSIGLRWPELLQMIQAAGNATLQKSESELQVLRKTFQLIVAQQKAGIPLDFNIIKKKALSSRPACGSSFAHLYQFALKYCGGVDGKFLAETEQYVRARGSTTALGDKVWEAICHEIKGSKNQAAFFRHGLLKSALTGMQMSATEVKRVFSNTSMVGKALKADGLMSELRGLVGSHVNLHDQNFVNVFAVVGHAESIPSASASTAKPVDRLVELNADGSLKTPGAILEAMNMKVGSCIRRRKDKMECEILAIDHAVKLKSEWLVFTRKAEVHGIEDLVPFGPRSVHPEFATAKTIAMIHMEIHALVDTHDMHDTMAKLKLHIRPTKLLAKTAVAKGKLMLVPFSSKVLSRSSSEPMQGGVEVTLKKGCQDRRFYIAASNVMPKASEEAPDDLVGFLSPFFLVQTVEDETKANMTMVLSGTKQSDVRIPMLKNSVALTAGQELLVHKEKAARQEDPLEAASPERYLDSKYGLRCKTWVPKQKEVNDGTFLALSKWDRQCILAFTDRALDLRANKDGGSLNSEVWAELIAARQEVANDAIEEAFKTEDHEQEKGHKKAKVLRASSKHDFMAPPILTVHYKGHAFRVLYEGLGGNTLWVEAKEAKVKKAAKSPKKRRQLHKAFTGHFRHFGRMVILSASMAGDDEEEMALFVELDLLESFHPMKRGWQFWKDGDWKESGLSLLQILQTDDEVEDLDATAEPTKPKEKWVLKDKARVSVKTKAMPKKKGQHASSAMNSDKPMMDPKPKTKQLKVMQGKAPWAGQKGPLKRPLPEEMLKQDGSGRGSYVRGFLDNGGQYWAPGSGRARARTRGRGGAGKQAAGDGGHTPMDNRLVDGLLQLAETVNIQAQVPWKRQARGFLMAVLATSVGTAADEMAEAGSLQGFRAG
ncbi:unnamed protein product [Symbiodinium sp. CCMP2456]|nr:unnamed protein product [Symbiodinium sp. CCMP2456]